MKWFLKKWPKRCLASNDNNSKAIKHAAISGKDMT